MKAINPVTVATELFAVIEQKEALEKREDELREKLLENLKKQGVGFVRLDNGTSFTRSHRETLKVVDEAGAKQWAEENFCLKIDAVKAMKILRRELSPLPSFFERKVGADYLTVKRGGLEDNE